MEQQRHYYEIGWRLNREQRQALKEKGLHIYATRSWDEGNGSTLEHRVIVNHETDVVCDFEALDESNPEAYANNYYEHMEQCNAIDTSEFGKMIEDIIKPYDR